MHRACLRARLIRFLDGRFGLDGAELRGCDISVLHGTVLGAGAKCQGTGADHGYDDKPFCIHTILHRKSNFGRFELTRSFLNTSAKQGFLQTASATVCSMEIEPLRPAPVEKSRNDEREKS